MLATPTSAWAAKGTVVAECGSKILVSAAYGYSILDLYGLGPNKGDVIVGSFDSYGMQTLYNLNNDREFKVYVEEYNLSRDDALEKFFSGRC